MTLSAIKDEIGKLSDRERTELTAWLDAQDREPGPISDAEFARRLAQAPEEDADDETVARVLAAESEKGQDISFDEMKRQLRL